MKKIIVLSAASLAFILSACSENSVGPVENGSLAKDQAITNSESLPTVEVPPTAEAETEDKDGLEFIYTLPNGAQVKYIYSKSGQLAEVIGLTGPYDYSLVIVKEFISYQDARKKALEALKGSGGEVENSVTMWKLENRSDVSRPYFEFDIQAERMYEVRLDAVTGSIIKVK